MIEYDEAGARKNDRAYLTPDVTRQRMLANAFTSAESLP